MFDFTFGKLFCEKNRNGAIGKLDITFDTVSAKFTETGSATEGEDPPF